MPAQAAILKYQATQGRHFLQLICFLFKEREQKRKKRNNHVHCLQIAVSSYLDVSPECTVTCKEHCSKQGAYGSGFGFSALHKPYTHTHTLHTLTHTRSSACATKKHSFSLSVSNALISGLFWLPPDYRKDMS